MESLEKYDKVRIAGGRKNGMRIESASKFPAWYDKEVVEVIPDENPATKPELEIEELHGELDTVKHENTKMTGQFEAVYIELPKVPDIYDVQSSKQSLNLPKALSKSNNNNSSSLLCRLCATQSINTIHMLDPNELYKNIVEKIEHCLPIKVRETDNLPKQACRTCLEKLELCYQFHKSVAEAEKQLLMLDEQLSVKLEESEESCQTSSLSSSTSFPEKPPLSDTILENNTVPSNSKLKSVEILPTGIHCSDSLNKDALSSGGASTSLYEQNSCYSAPKSPIQQVDLKEELKCSNEEFDSEFILPLILECDQASNNSNPEPIRDNCNDDGKTINCLVCKTGFETAEECQTHASRNGSQYSYSCCICDEICQTKRDWGKHFLEHTEHEISKSVAVGNSFGESENKFVSKLKRKFHELGVDLSTELRSVSAKQIRNEEEPNAIECSLCKERFHPDLLKLHKQNCRVEKSKRNQFTSLTTNKCFTCGHCEMTFKQQRHMVAHLRTHKEQPGRAVECTLCKEKFHPDLLKSHKKGCRVQNFKSNPSISPTTNECFTCRHCGKTFEQQRHMVAHLRTHDKEQPGRAVECTLCKKKFHPDLLKSHKKGCRVQNFQSNPSISPTTNECFTCRHCGKTFEQKRFIIAHLRTHDEEQLGLVSKKHLNKSQIRRCHT